MGIQSLYLCSQCDTFKKEIYSVSDYKLAWCCNPSRQNTVSDTGQKKETKEMIMRM